MPTEFFWGETDSCVDEIPNVWRATGFYGMIMP